MEDVKDLACRLVDVIYRYHELKYLQTNEHQSDVAVESILVNDKSVWEKINIEQQKKISANILLEQPPKYSEGKLVLYINQATSSKDTSFERRTLFNYLLHQIFIYRDMAVTSDPIPPTNPLLKESIITLLLHLQKLCYTSEDIEIKYDNQLIKIKGLACSLSQLQGLLIECILQPLQITKDTIKRQVENEGELLFLRSEHKLTEKLLKPAFRRLCHKESDLEEEKKALIQEVISTKRASFNNDSPAPISNLIGQVGRSIFGVFAQSSTSPSSRSTREFSDDSSGDTYDTVMDYL